ncbi:MAG TPA: VanZ family protein [candidate division Zixibacteria bacterium]|nr:VanZ family protein [candidate division Zixibacteria bacterium]
MLKRTQLGFWIYVLAVIGVSLLPSRALAGTGSADKLGHFLAYAIMTFWGLMAFKSRRAAVVIILFSLSLGITLEYLQQFISGRDPSVADGLANMLGVLAGMIFYWLMRIRIGR